MLKFIKIRIKGFASYEGDNELDLCPNSAVVIKAPNGSGKSTIFSALVWCLYGKTIKGVSDVNTKKKYQTKDYQGTLVTVYFQKDGDVYSVTRCQNYTGNLDDGTKGRDRLQVVKNAEVIDIKSKPKLQEYLVSELGLSYSLFMNSIMFGQGMKKLIQETNSDKKKIFEEVFNLNYLNVAKNMAQKGKNQASHGVDVAQSEYNATNREYESCVDTYHELKESEGEWDKRRKKSIQEKEAKIKDLKNNIDKKKSSLGSSKLVKEDIQANKLQEQALKEKLDAARNISNQPLNEVIDAIITLLEKNQVQKALKKVKSIKKAYSDIEKYSEEREKVLEILSELRSKEREVQRAEYVLNNLRENLKEAKEELKALENDTTHKVTSPKYRKKAKVLKIKLKEQKVILEQRKKELEDYEWLLNDPLSNKGIKAFLFDSSLGQLNDTLEKYSEVLGFRISFEVDLDSTKKDFVTLIEMDGEIYDYDELSGGQQQLCNVAMAFAMNESLTASKDINIAFLDEVFESLSMDNVEIVIGLIKKIFEEKVLFLITHHESIPLSRFKTLRVERLNGRSSFKLL
ncbi:MAG: AAA family ATPase [Roseburia sp.]|nr:AAA family ATPase [Roseburia sp.]